MKKIIFLIIVLFSISSVFAQNDYYVFKTLPYSYKALEPWIDSATMKIHYEKHHKTYYDKFVKAMHDNKLENKPMVEIFRHVSKYPETIRNMGGGYWNHEFFWESMSGTKTEMSDKLKDAIIKDFGSVDAMIQDLDKQATGLFGSGWAWLILTKNHKLIVVTSANQDNPLMDIAKEKGTPLLCIDIWEHAYYLKYQNKRADYVKNFWNIVNWAKVSERFDESMK